MRSQTEFGNEGRSERRKIFKILSKMAAIFSSLERLLVCDRCLRAKEQRDILARPVPEQPFPEPICASVIDS